MNTSTWESSTTPQLVFMVWTSTLSSPDQEREYKEEEQELEFSETSKKSARKNPSNGSLRNSVALFSEEAVSSIMMMLLSKTNFANNVTQLFFIYFHFIFISILIYL